mgnify:CR=1 FL=1
MRTRIGRRLIGVEFDPATLRYVHSVADRWRLTGLSVDVTDYIAPAGEAHGYVLTAASGTTIMVLRCQRWQQRRWFRRARPVWSIVISLRQRDTGAGEGQGEWLPIREIGAVAALDQDELWQQIDAWIDGRLRPAASVEEAVADLA